jgi:AraC-like DNA-binding protein
VDRGHDRSSNFLAPAPGPAGRRARPPAARPAAPGADTLSDVLRTVRLTGALFFRTAAAAPWVLEIPPGPALAPALRPGAQQVISYHVVARGACWGGLLDGPPVRLAAGDVLVLPHGDAYAMSLAPALRGGPPAADVLAFLRQMAAGDLPFTVREGGAGPERLHLVCGFLACDVRPFNPLLATLPRLLHVRAASAPAGDLLSRLVQLTVAEARARRPGGEAVRLRLSELLFVEVVRRHLATLGPGATGWLAGLRDPQVGDALARLHARPAEAWTLARLARETGLARSGLAARFAHLVGLPPMLYLARWRMQLAARRLADGTAKVAAVAEEVGYDSEAAFSRAFKRLTGVPPAAWRRGQASPSAGAR